MGFVSLAPLLLWTIVGTTPPTGAGALPPLLPEPIITRQNVFAVPYHIQRPTDSSMEPAEIHLYVSADQGASWQLSSRVKPAQGQFVFQAPADGEYWFVVRTMDRAGGLRPQGIQGPELRVVVDTTPPVLQLHAQRGADGQITVQWDVNELRVKPESFLLQYRAGFEQSWETIAIDPRSQRISGPHWTGEVTWWPRAASGILEIRAEVADAAGNPAVSHAQVDMVDSRPPASAAPDRRLAAAPPASQGGTGAMGPWRGIGDAVPPAGSPGGDPARNAPAVPSPNIAALPVGLGPQVSPRGADPGEAANRARGGADPRVPLPAPAASDAPIRSAAPGSVAMQFSPAIENQYSPRRAPSPAPPVAASGNAMRPRMINAREFQLEYALSSVGGSGASRVEVWGTRDGGQTWRMFAADDNGRSPILVRVDEEGLYGFRTVARNGHVHDGESPPRGDPPDIWIGVDLTKPVGRFTAVQEGTGEQSGQLYINWETNDRAPAAHGVTLYYSVSPYGPWIRIAGDLEASGRYVWRLDKALPGQLYLRLEVSDEAGNVATIDNPDPLVLEYVRPLARIRDMRPLPQNESSLR